MLKFINYKLDKLVSGAENKVLVYVVKGYTNYEIAKKLNLSKRTVETHITNMLSKTNLKNRVQLTRFVIDCDATFLKSSYTDF
jgi:DNA-binding NarL/FixJ family response regulator|tara:strand:+ start:9983 stop:10231 length:249 start_codon:yes stop_codon:yes gene_type:complete